MRRKVVAIAYCMLVILLGIMLIFAWVLYLAGIDLRGNGAKDARGVYEFNWGVTINDGWVEVYSAETDHDGRGEGLRYQVYEPNRQGNTVGISARDGESDISVARGFGEEKSVDDFLNELCEQLDVPSERCRLTEDHQWMQFLKEDGSCLVVVSDDDRICIAEKLV